MMISMTAYSQIRIVPQERLKAVTSPRLACDSSALSFDTRYIAAPKMNEDDDPVTFIYNMTNVGNKTLEIKLLRTTCSCVTAVSDVSALKPGQTARISVRYNPKGHPGKFERKVFVYTQDGNDPSAVLRLSVEVESGADLSDEYPVQMGPIRLRRAEIVFTEGVKSVEKLRFINLSGKDIKLGCETAFLPGCLSFEARPENVPAGMEGEIVISYDPKKELSGKEMKVMLKGLGLPPSRTSIKVVTISE